MNRLIDALLRFVRKQFIVLKSSGMATDETNEGYNNLVNIVEDNREVAWADQTSQTCRDIEPLNITNMTDRGLSFVTGDSSRK